MDALNVFQGLLELADKISVEPYRALHGEQRREQRLAASTPVRITVLGIPGWPKAAGIVVDLSGSGLRLKLALPLPCGAPVKVETGDMLLLGEVVRCDAAGPVYEIGIAVAHSLAALSELERLNRALLGTDPRTTVDDAEPLTCSRDTQLRY